jgi:hypothetical protein
MLAVTVARLTLHHQSRLPLAWFDLNAPAPVR